MSDQDKKNEEQKGEEALNAEHDTVEHPEPATASPAQSTDGGPASAAAGSDDATEETTPPPRAAEPAPAPAPQKKSGSSLPGWLALILVIALAGGLYWFFPQWQHMQQRESQLLDRIAGLEQEINRRQSNLDALEQRVLDRFRADLGEVEQDLAGMRQTGGDLQGQLAELRSELARFSATDPEAWLLAEAEYLLRLANQRLVMAGDVNAAQALISSADAIVRELDDASLHEVRGALAGDLAAVRAVPRIDVEGIYLRLAALAEQATRLVIFELPNQEDLPRDVVQEDDWQVRLQRGYEEAAGKLSDYIIIRRRDVPMEALMDPQWEGLVRQNLRMLLEQAQVALLSGNQQLYSESLERAQHWVAQFFESDEAAARAMDSELRQLQSETVAVDLPDLSRSLRALDDAIEARLQQGGAE